MSGPHEGAPDGLEVERARRFALIPDALIFDAELSAGAVRLWAVLDRYANRAGEAWPSIATLAERLGVGRRTVERQLADLEARGWLTRHERTRGDGARTSSRIVLHDVAPASPVSHGPRADDASPTSPVSHASLNESQMNESQRRDTPPSPPSKELVKGSADVLAVLAHWTSSAFAAGVLRDTSRVRLTAGRREKIERRLREGYSVADLCRAVDAALASEFHRARPEWLELSSILGSREKVDRHLARGELTPVARADDLARASHSLAKADALVGWMGRGGG